MKLENLAGAGGLPEKTCALARGDQPLWSIEPVTRSDGSVVDVLVSANGSQRPRTPGGDRLHLVFAEKCAEIGPDECNNRTAVDYQDAKYSYADLANLSNQVARFLRAQGVSPDDRVAVLFDRSILSHATVLALSKLDAAYVPLDATFPADRLEYIIQDSGAAFIVTLSEFTYLFDGVGIEPLALDRFTRALEHESQKPLPAGPLQPGDPICYIIYTSGSTGHPKGVPVRHSAICNFIRVARDHYGYHHDDRVYQGMTMAFDFSVEELWVPLCAGATLVPAPSGASLLGPDLAAFLRDTNVTALCCVPTLLATLEVELPQIRFLLVSGEVCPDALAERWHAPQRRFLNVYGPTETTVSATWSQIRPGQAVTIGGPLPTYSIVILAPNSQALMDLGEKGEICIAGIGLAEGYLNRPGQTTTAFIDDFIGLPNNPGGKIYRSGDFGRINADYEIEYGGRIDTQVKIRGYRIDLGEIESAIEQCEQVAQAVVQPCEITANHIELVGYIKWRSDEQTLPPADIQSRLQQQLPAYMVPAYYQTLAEFPLLPSSKIDRKCLPRPSGPRLTSTGRRHVEPAPGLESDLAAILARVLQVEKVSADANFFDELGANSFLIARFASAIRTQLKVKGISMKNLYQQPTIRGIAGLAAAPPTRDSVDPVAPERSGRQDNAATRAPSDSTTYIPPDHSQAPHRASGFAYFACGIGQALYYATQVLIATTAMLIAYHWVAGASAPLDYYTRAVIAGTLIFFAGGCYLIAVKWLAVGRFRDQPIRLWSFQYFRFWVARSAIQMNPLNLFVGTPSYNLFLRLLGCRVGRGAVIFARPPICTDLVSIGSDAIIRQDSLLRGYTTRSGFVIPGRVTIGERAVLGEASVVEINATIDNGAQLGRSSALLEGGVVPAGKVFHGSPAEETEVSYDTLPVQNVRLRASVYTCIQSLALVLIVLPLPLLATVLLAGLLANAGDHSHSIAGNFVNLAIITAIAYFGSLVSGLLIVTTIPRLLNKFVKPNTVHPLYGVQFALARGIYRFSNSRVLNTLFGDSSMIVFYLSAVGYDLSQSTQTGSNFGVNQQHHNPFLNTFNRNTMVSDGLMLLNMEVSSSSFRMSSISVPTESFLGNLIHYPPHAKVGENCLIATKAMVPVDGPLRENVGILGSPPFEIPRSVARDRRFDHYKNSAVVEQRLWMKLKSNLSTLALYIFRIWSSVFAALIISTLSYSGITKIFGESLAVQAVALSAAAIGYIVFTICWAILLERLATGFRGQRPLHCSLYDPDFWEQERFWKMNQNLLLMLFNGTAMKAMFLRMQGARVGARLFDDGAALTEPGLTTIGDYCCFDHDTSLQCHSLEDGAFKSDHINIGDDCNFAVRSFVHYGTQIEDQATILADAFVMKGTLVEADSVWCGNPARIANDGDVEWAAFEQPADFEPHSHNRCRHP